MAYLRYKMARQWKQWTQVVFGAFIAVVFGIVFNSPFLGALAFVFLCYIPLPEEEEAKKWTLKLNRWGFVFLMFVILFWAFGVFGIGLGLDLGGPLYAPWTWNSTAIIFIGIWVISLLVGWSGDPDTKRPLGIVIIAVSFIIFTIGIGTQEVGQAFFGPWWPTVYQAGSQIFGPIGQAFSQLQQTLGQGWLLLTNPVGYAQQMMAGTYAVDPMSGLAGAYGVEIQRFEVGAIYPYQPFFVTVLIKNMGAFDAKNIDINLGTTDPRVDVGSFGFDKTREEIENLSRQDSRQILFIGNLSCKNITEKDMRRIPLKFNISLKYDYQIASELNLEFISASEWDRLIREGKLITQAKKAATLTNAPVRLNIDSLEQPIREGTPFFIGLALVPAKEGNITSANISLEVPTTFKPASASCSLSDGRATWTNLKPPYVIFCQFNALQGLPPTQTFLIKANASYTFQTAEDAIAKIEFGGGCCADADCPTGYVCSGVSEVDGKMGACVPKGEEPKGEEPK